MSLGHTTTGHHEAKENLVQQGSLIIRAITPTPLHAVPPDLATAVSATCRSPLKGMKAC